MRTPSGIRTYETPQGVYVLQDELMHRQIVIQPQELQYVPHIIENALHQLIHPRHKLLDLVRSLVDVGLYYRADPSRFFLLGEYGERIITLVSTLSNGDDEYDWFSSLALTWHYEPTDSTWTDSARHVYGNPGLTWEQYKLRAEVSGWRVYSHEDFLLVEAIFEEVKPIFNF